MYRTTAPTGCFHQHSWSRKVFKTQDNMLPFGLQIHLSYRISDLLIGSKGMSELWGTLVLETVLRLFQKLVRALSSTISLSLIDKHNRGRTRRECHKCQTVHTEDQHSARTQWCIVPRWLPVIRGKCTLEKVCAFLLGGRTPEQKLSIRPQSFYVYIWGTFPTSRQLQD